MLLLCKVLKKHRNNTIRQYTNYQQNSYDNL